MDELNTKPNVANLDDIYQKLIDAHAGLTDAESMALNSRLILLLINHIGDGKAIAEAISAAKGK